MVFFIILFSKLFKLRIYRGDVEFIESSDVEEDVRNYIKMFKRKVINIELVLMLSSNKVKKWEILVERLVVVVVGNIKVKVKSSFSVNDGFKVLNSVLILIIVSVSIFVMV